MTNVFGAALPVLGLAMAAVFVAPTLSDTPRGEALVVSAPSDGSLWPASFNSADCSAAKPPTGGDAADRAATRMFAIVISDARGDFSVMLRETLVDESGPGTPLLLLDGAGRASPPQRRQISGRVACGDANRDFPPPQI